jgi:hypothetical protein
MRRNTEFKLLIDALENPRLFSICDFPTAQYVSECPGFVNDTELLNKVLLFLLVKL